MNRKAIVIALASAGLASAANAQQLDELLLVDLSVPDQITITATSGVSASTISGGDTTGALLANFYTAGNDAAGTFADAAAAGDFTNFLNPADNTPGIFRGNTPADGISNGLNVWTWSSDITVDFVAGTQAFTGSLTATLDSDEYLDMINSVSVGSTGEIFFPADTDDDIAGATVLGTWRVVPTPGAVALFGIGGLAATRRRR